MLGHNDLEQSERLVAETQPSPHPWAESFVQLVLPTIAKHSPMMA